MLAVALAYFESCLITIQMHRSIMGGGETNWKTRRVQVMEQGRQFDDEQIYMLAKVLQATRYTESHGSYALHV